MKEIVKRIDLWGLNMVFVVGGNGGNAAAHAIAEECEAQGECVISGMTDPQCAVGRNRAASRTRVDSKVLRDKCGDITYTHMGPVMCRVCPAGVICSVIGVRPSTWQHRPAEHTHMHTDTQDSMHCCAH